ncbi:hypothetical protein [Micromonospora craniellae]|uniref:Uncharacterized protein n=1 Tax=Micromonospora craniellae TaxID=2294034 RepID=A0A372G077_9ACTN|nr:hypothetical protein [Micromonospora craniellae]QOC94583.1 hypothetical protein ID554_14070 [Micromonospora craniellae]RFS46373.1 hypothetical protein D0Q02_11355 [Micromonospora craniellae]
MAMVNLPARQPHRSRITYAFGVLALLGAAATMLVLVRDPALSSTRLAEPVPAPEITVVETDPVGPYGVTGGWHEFGPDGTADQPGDDPASANGGDPSGDTVPTTHATGADPRQELSRSLFWSGVFGLAISLAGLGLVGTRRRLW